MAPEALVVALGPRRYAVERPWGALPPGAGKVTDVAVSPGGRVHVLTRRDHYVEAPADCVHVLAPDGAHLVSWGRGRIVDAHMLACAADGLTWVVDRDSHEVVAFDRDGRAVRALGRRHQPFRPFNHPTDVSLGPGGSIWVSEGYGGCRFHAFTAEGEPAGAWGRIGTAPGEFVNAHAIWALPDGRVLVADRENDRVQVFSPAGALLAVWTGFHRPSDIWADAGGNVFVSDGIPSLALLASDGRRIGRCRPVLNGAHGLAGDDQGNLFLAEGNPSRVTRLRRLPDATEADQTGQG